MMKLSVLPYLKKIQKIYESLGSADIGSFSPEISKFGYIKKYRYRFYSDLLFITFLNFLESLKILLINMVTVLIMSAKMVVPDLLKTKEFWNKGYDIIIFVNVVTNKILSRDSNDVVHLVPLPKFGNSSISMRKVIITSILYGFDQKHCFF